MINHILSPEHIVFFSHTTFEDLVREVLEKLIPGASPKTRRSIGESLLQRERLSSTLLPNGVGFPRAEAACVKEIVCAVGISENGVSLHNESDVPVHTLFVSLYPEGCFRQFVPVLEDLVRLSEDAQKMAKLRSLPRHEEDFSARRKEAFLSAARDWAYAHLLSPFNSMRHRVEASVRVHHD